MAKPKHITPATETDPETIVEIENTPDVVPDLPDPLPDPETRTRITPVDKSGVELKVGDPVVIAAVVTAIDVYGDEGDNLAVELVEPHYPKTTRQILSLNSRQVQQA